MDFFPPGGARVSKNMCGFSLATLVPIFRPCKDHLIVQILHFLVEVMVPNYIFKYEFQTLDNNSSQWLTKKSLSITAFGWRQSPSLNSVNAKYNYWDKSNFWKYIVHHSPGPCGMCTSCKLVMAVPPSTSQQVIASLIDLYTTRIDRAKLYPPPPPQHSVRHTYGLNCRGYVDG